ncbi:MAG: hypothetical protein HC852_13305, partial [Acaryochloridaceae cyanobacterium RU_4_10]|nr:hypothetical protein [Acaryochloridaceae cyanobacterium RU_4_10]
PVLPRAIQGEAHSAAIARLQTEIRFLGWIGGVQKLMSQFYRQRGFPNAAHP